MADVTRRQAMAGLGCLGASLGLSGCASPIVPFCPGDPTISDPDAPLTIDIHSHVFNGTDLQIEGFYTHVVKRKTDKQVIATILKMFADNFAPSGAKELAALSEVEVALRSCNGTTFVEIYNSHAQDSYSRFLKALKAANNEVKAQPFARASTSRRLDAFINSLPSDYKTYRQRRARIALTEPTFAGEFAFVLQNFNYRYVNVYDYLLKYSTGRTRKIDIIVAHLVDYDWPLGGGSTTTTNLADQFRVMDKISQLTGGRVSVFCAFRSVQGSGVPAWFNAGVFFSECENRDFTARLRWREDLSPHGLCAVRQFEAIENLLESNLAPTILAGKRFASAVRSGVGRPLRLVCSKRRADHGARKQECRTKRRFPEPCGRKVLGSDTR